MWGNTTRTEAELNTEIMHFKPGKGQMTSQYRYHGSFHDSYNRFLCYNLEHLESLRALESSDNMG